MDTKLIKLDLHCHTEASSDCISPIEKVAYRIIETGINVQAITDHNEIWGAIKLKEFVESNNLDLQVIIGEEITTSEGELIGLFLQNKIEAGLTPEETVRQIHHQGGLVLLPHGFDPFKRYRLTATARRRIRKGIDIVEGFNTRISVKRFNKEAVAWAKKHNKAVSAGTDAHTIKDIGSAWVAVEDRPINTPDDLMKSLEKTEPMGIWVHPWIAFAYKKMDMVKEQLFPSTKKSN